MAGNDKAKKKGKKKGKDKARRKDDLRTSAADIGVSQVCDLCCGETIAAVLWSHIF